MGSATALNLTRSFEVLECGECGIEFWVPQHWANEKRRDHTGWKCPNGHSRIFSNLSDVEIAKREAREALEKLEWERKRVAKLERESKKLKRRIAAGVCPCCHRTFENLQRHMTGEHPDFLPTPKTAVA